MYALLFSLQESAAEAPATIQPMTPTGWAFMIVSVSFVLVLTAWCFYRVLTAPKEPTKAIEDFHTA